MFRSNPDNMSRDDFSAMQWAHLLAGYLGYHGPTGLGKVVKASTQDTRASEPTLAGTTLPQSETDHRRSQKLMGMRGVAYDDTYTTMAGTTIHRDYSDETDKVDWYTDHEGKRRYL